MKDRLLERLNTFSKRRVGKEISPEVQPSSVQTRPFDKKRMKESLSIAGAIELGAMDEESARKILKASEE